MKKNKSKLTSQILSKYVKKYANGGPGDDLVAKQDNTRTNSYTPKQELSEEGKVWAKNEWDKALKKREEELSNYSKKGMLSAMKEPVDIKSYAEQSLRYNESSTSDKLKDAAVDLTLGLAPELLLSKFGKTPNIIKSTINPTKNTVKEAAKSTFKSEVDWAKWNKEIPDNKSLVDEYNSIEQSSKANNTWMKNPDGSAFQGTPEQFVQQNSSNFKKAFPEGSENVFRGTGENIAELRPNRSIFTANQELASGYAPFNKKSIFLNSESGEGGVHSFYRKNSKNSLELDANNTSWTSVDLSNKRLTKDYFERNIKSQEDQITKQKEYLSKMKQNPNGSWEAPDGTTYSNDLYKNTVAERELYLKDLKERYKNIDNLISNPKELEEMRKVLGNTSTTDDIATYVEKRNLDYVKLKNIEDSGVGDVTIVNHKPGNYLKSAVGNNGMFDMDNPNIYKTVIPGVLGTAALTNEENMKKYGGLIRKKYDVGGQLPGDDKTKTYTNKAEYDKALQAYNDSLDLHNLYKYQEGISGNTGKVIDTNAKILTSSDLHKDARQPLGFEWYGGSPVSHQDAVNYEKKNNLPAYPSTNTEEYEKLKSFNKNPNINIVKRDSPEFYHNSISPIGNYKSTAKAANFIYKKPVVKPEYVSAEDLMNNYTYTNGNDGTYRYIPIKKPVQAKGTLEQEVKPTMAKGTVGDDSNNKPIWMPDGTKKGPNDFKSLEAWQKASGQKFAYGGKMKYDVGGPIQSMNADGTYGVEEQPQDNTNWANMVGMAGNMVQGTQNYSKSPNASMYKTEDAVWDTVGQMGPVGAVVGGIANIANSAFRPLRESNDKKAGTSGYSNATTIGGGLLNPLAALQTRSQYEGGYGDISGKGYEKYMAGKNKQAKFNENIGVFDANLGQHNTQVDYLRGKQFDMGGSMNFTSGSTLSKQGNINNQTITNFSNVDNAKQTSPFTNFNGLDPWITFEYGGNKPNNWTLIDDNPPMANGGQMTTSYQTGGTHESNPLGGIPIGQDSLVEEGEVRFDYKDKSKNLKSYIFSNKIKYKK